MPPAGFKPAILASERSQTHSLDRAATAIANTPAADTKVNLTFRHSAPCILGQAFHYSTENAFCIFNQQIKKKSVALVRMRTIPTERPPPVGEVSANFCG